jgi:hypothetical protein
MEYNARGAAHRGEQTKPCHQQTVILNLFLDISPPLQRSVRVTAARPHTRYRDFDDFAREMGQNADPTRHSVSTAQSQKAVTSPSLEYH